VIVRTLVLNVPTFGLLIKNEESVPTNLIIIKIHRTVVETSKPNVKQQNAVDFLLSSPFVLMILS
jgi:hypothetical protein